MLIEDYHNQILKLLPKGDLWQDMALFKRLFLPLAQALKYIEERIWELLRESRALSAVSTLDDKEKDWGLPDPCTGQLSTIYERQVALWQKMTDTGGNRDADFIQLAARLGYTISITEASAFSTESTCEDFVTAVDAWRLWNVDIQSAQNQTFIRQEFTTESTIEERINSSSIFNIECVFNARKPAHTIINFIYSLGD